jgi:hypothetical protein
VALIERPVDTRGESEASSNASEPSRARRLFAGWSANLVQMILGMTQEVALVPVFLHYWTADVLAAWLVIYAAGNLVLVADAGLQFRAIHRFLAFKSSADSDGRTAQFYAAMRRESCDLMEDQGNIGGLHQRLQASRAVENTDPADLLGWLEARRSAESDATAIAASTVARESEAPATRSLTSLSPSPSRPRQKR